MYDPQVTIAVEGAAPEPHTVVRHHIDELTAIGVPPPSTVPVYYRVAAGMITQADRIQVLGNGTSGEV